MEAVEAEQECGQELEEEVQEVCGRRSQEAQEGRIQGGHTANRWESEAVRIICNKVSPN